MTSRMNIPVYTPLIDDSEYHNVLSALKSGEISGSSGKFVKEFERDFCLYSDCSYGVAVTSGTTALHLALAALGIGNNDEVLVSTFTNMATFFAVLYQHAPETHSHRY